MRARLACLASAAILAGTAAPSAAAPKSVPPARVVAESPSVEVLRGGRTRIMLKGIERNNNLLRYEIIRAPRHGRLAPLEQPDPNRQGPGFVVYAHGDDESSRTDTFVYRVTAPISGQSSTGTVTVNILDAPPRLGAPRLLEFSAVVGESATKVLSLTNTGGGVLRGEVKVKPPFRVEGSGVFELGRGQTTRIPIQFVPSQPGLAAPERIQPAPRNDPSATVALVGDASPPFAVKTTSEELALRSDDSRTATVELVNLSPHPQEISIALDPPGPAEAPASVQLPPGGTSGVILRIPPELRGGPAQVRATFFTAAHAESREFSAPPVPARLEILTPEIDFGEAMEVPFTVENAGGVEGRFTLSLPDDLGTVEGAASFAVPAGARTTVRLRRRDSTGPEGEIVYEAAGSDPVRIPFRCTPPPPPEMTDPKPPPPPPAPRWTLNEDVRLEEPAPGEKALVFAETKEAWTNAELEVQEAGSSDWQPFLPPPPPAPNLGFFQRIHEKISRSLAPLARRDETSTGVDPAPAAAASPSQAQRPLAGRSFGEGERWRLTAEPANASRQRTAVSEVFRINALGTGLAAIETPPPPPAHEAPEATPAPVPYRLVEWIGQETTRTSAQLQIALRPDPAVTAYRLERLAIVMAIDPSTGIPQLPEVEPAPHDGEVKILSVEPAQSEGREVTLVTAALTGLPPGMETVWRLVPLSGNTELPATKEIFVRTLPPWRVSWGMVWIGASFALLLAALIHRWRSHRPPG